jgi:hypothetical protein
MGINPKDLIGLTKTPFRLIPKSALVCMAWVMSLGAKKYGPFNWRENDVRMTVYTEAAMRHLIAIETGEDIDPESGQPHAAHVMSCMGIIIDAQQGGNLVDDRFKENHTTNLMKETHVQE